MKKLLCFCTLAGVICVVYLNFQECKNDTSNKNLLAMYLQNSSGGYDLSTEKSFPTEGYHLNEEKSFCINGGTLSQNESSKTIALSVKGEDKCTLYFDKEHNALDEIFGQSNGSRTKFGEPATTDEGIFEMEDDYGMSYYYRGAVENNYVKFGKDVNDKNMYWRIVRVNGDGSLRIVYHGSQVWTIGSETGGVAIQGDSILDEAVWSDPGDAKYAGWMFSPSGSTASTSKESAQTNENDSSIKKLLDNWYEENIKGKDYEKMLSDTLFCNDRSTAGTGETWHTGDTKLGYGENATYYGGFGRILTSSGSAKDEPSPTFKCSHKNDAFTVSDTSKGNGSLKYPIGLLTVDEVIAAGSGKYESTNKSYYLYKEDLSYWTMTPYNFAKSSWTIGTACGAGDGVKTFTYGTTLNSLYNGYTCTVGVSPVLNIKSEYAKNMRGTGTPEDPYVLE